MEQQFYQEYAIAETEHWWFVARRQIIAKALDSLHLNPDSDILEVGCGPGGNLELLSRYGNVSALESDVGTREIANSRKIVQVEQGALPDNIPFGDNCFDLIAMFDVLEHIDDDAGALDVLHKRLRPDGILLLTVPAYNFLWSHHDVVNQHKRRYTRKRLIKLAQDAGYQVAYSTYFNTLLFPLVLAVRLLEKLLHTSAGNEVEMPPKPLNVLLKHIFASERILLPHLSLPFGVSIMVIARKPRADTGRR